MNTNFNVSAFAALQAKARTIFIDTINNLKIVQQLCEEMSSLVSSADSGLAGSWSGVAQVLNEPINSANMIFDGVNNAMTKYAADVIANEEKEMQNLDKYNSSISSLTGAAKILSESINGNSAANLQGEIQINPEGISNINLNDRKSDNINVNLNDRKTDMNGNYRDAEGNYHHNNDDGTYTVTSPDGTSRVLWGDHVEMKDLSDINNMIRNGIKRD